MRSNVCYLIAVVNQKDEYGVNRPTETRKKVFCGVDSVTSSEWFEGGRMGLNPEKRATIFFADWSGEEIVELDGVRYTVYRTYENGDKLELYLERKKGNAQST